ncbi:acid-sensing ion channel 1 isoform X2 [Brachionus plicatilis]|uniref:Acid-sensing ion channel 1 isoform X2 n=1 Tax=Brachionus plicatilis TaxID=10195 RepID=A0A3M7RWS2_BRAPC|nr:acid-sensing ion channel 1 isoform X2 [Brachionus plicatilis]
MMKDRINPDNSNKTDLYGEFKNQAKKFEAEKKTEMQKFYENQQNLIKKYSNNNFQIKELNSTNKIAISATPLDDSVSAKMSSRKIIKQKLVDWASNTKSHGVPNIMRVESTFLRIVWTICFVASLGYCIYTIVGIIQTFLLFEVLINQQVVTDSPIEFPAVTVCNLNPFDRRKAQGYIDQVLAKNNLSYVSDVNKIDKNPRLINTLIKSSIIGNPNLTAENIEQLGFHIDYMLLTCYFNDIPCSQSEFVLTYDFDFVNCYTFNSGYDRHGNKVPVKRINEAGADQSLKLELFLGYDLTQSQYILNSGARVVVHNQSAKPIISNEGIDIPSGFQTNIGLKRSFFHKLDTPYSTCVKNSKSPDGYHSFFYKAIFNRLNMKVYRQKVCLRLCLQEFILNECKCLDGSLPNIYQNKSVCESISSLECVADSRGEYFSSISSSSCSQCPLECDSYSFQLTTSSSRYPTLYYRNYLSEQTNILSRFPEGTKKNEITKSTVLINVFYDDLATTYTTETAAVSPVALLGNIGGNLGLFIGISLLTFVEIIEFLISVFLICLKKIYLK